MTPQTNLHTIIKSRAPRLQSWEIDGLVKEIEGAGYGPGPHARNLESRNAAFTSMLRNLEWTHYDDTDQPVWCRSCHGNVRTGHKEDCQLAKLLEEVE